MGFRSAVAGVAKNIVLGAPSTLKIITRYFTDEAATDETTTRMKLETFESSEDEARCVELLEHLSNAILPEDTLDVLNQLRDCVRESRTSQMVVAKVGGD